MNLSDDKSDNLFSDNYNDDSFFKDGDGADLLSNNASAAKAQKEAPKPITMKQASSMEQKSQESYKDVSNAFDDNYDDFGFDEPKATPTPVIKPVVKK